MNSLQNVNTAKSLIYEILPLIDDAKTDLKKARMWGIGDLLGGGLFFDLFKHMKMNNAKSQMYEVNAKLKELEGVLSGIQIPGDYRMNVNGFLTFADFLFDGVIFDAVMFSKIWQSIDALEDLETKLQQTLSALDRMSF